MVSEAVLLMHRGLSVQAGAIRMTHYGNELAVWAVEEE